MAQTPRHVPRSGSDGNFPFFVASRKGFPMDSGNVAWILASSALVCMMIPALALFYGGMVGSRRILNMMMMCFGGASLVAVLWALFGYSPNSPAWDS
jgi:Amt family ammonium transporter